MPKDKNGIELKVGDRVQMTFEVTSLKPGEGFDNTALKCVDHYLRILPSGTECPRSVFCMTMNSGAMEKVATV